MRIAPSSWVASALVLSALSACESAAAPTTDGGDAGAPLLDGASGTDAGPGDPSFVARCDYTNTFAMRPECREYRGPGWQLEQATADCTRVFFGRAGTLTVGERCSFPDQVGVCTVGTLGTVGGMGYTITSSGGPSACGPAQSACETFARGTFTPAPICVGCELTGSETTGGFTPMTVDCRDPRPGEPAGTGPGGQVCTPTIISGSTEPGRQYADYASCDVVRTQRPYYMRRSTAPMAGADDPRLADTTYMGEVDWLRTQAEASACACCHTASRTPAGAGIWDTEAGPLWVDTVSDAALAMLAGFTDSAAFGYLPAAQNNGFDRSTTGLPTTDVPRLQAFATRELARRGLTVDQARGLPPFAPFFRDLIDYRPSACPDGVGVDASGALHWTGGTARYISVLRADAPSPGVPPNWDLPEGTLWAIAVPPTSLPMGCGTQYGALPPNAYQRVPATGAAPALVSGETYYLYVQRDVAQPITRCTFTAP
jgi:hypothetical protein